VKARTKELLEQATAAMLAAIEIYNKPRFTYRAQSFAILALNAWELLLKAKWLVDHKNYLPSLYVRQGGGPKRKRIKKTRSGNPMTHSLEFLADKLRQSKALPENAYLNLKILTELRDTAVHFYRDNSEFEKRLHEIGAAAVTNFYAAARDWFAGGLPAMRGYFMPLAFVTPQAVSGTSLTLEEKRILKYISSQIASAGEDAGSPYAVAVNLELRFVRSKSQAATPVRVSTDPDALPVYLTEEDIRQRWPWTYKALTIQCRGRYSDFKENRKYHDLRKQLEFKPAYAHERLLDPDNPTSTKKVFYSSNILQEFDKHYTRKTAAAAAPLTAAENSSTSVNAA
jgi:hypothetical protein